LQKFFQILDKDQGQQNTPHLLHKTLLRTNSYLPLPAWEIALENGAGWQRTSRTSAFHSFSLRIWCM